MICLQETLFAYERLVMQDLDFDMIVEAPVAFNQVCLYFCGWAGRSVGRCDCVYERDRKYMYTRTYARNDFSVLISKTIVEAPVYMYIYVYIYVYINIYICTYIYVYIYTCLTANISRVPWQSHAFVVTPVHVCLDSFLLLMHTRAPHFPRASTLQTLLTSEVNFGLIKSDFQESICAFAREWERLWCESLERATK